MRGRGPIGSNGVCCTLCWFSVTPSTTYNQIGPFWCCFLSGWVCVRSRTLWVSPLISTVRLGVSPAASTPPQVFSVSGLRLYFPMMELWVSKSVTRSTSCCLTDQLQHCPPCTTIRHLAGSSSFCLAQSASHLLAANALCPAAHLCPSYRSG